VACWAERSGPRSETAWAGISDSEKKVEQSRGWGIESVRARRRKRSCADGRKKLNVVIMANGLERNEWMNGWTDGGAKQVRTHNQN
jgi:hypothetical protein